MIFCLLRKIWIPATPEEKVRQECLHMMVTKLGYPLSNIAIEKSLHDLPNLKETPALNRRLDLLVYRQGKPFLLAECKKGSFTSKAFEQVKGYNYFVGAPFLSLIGPGIAKTNYHDKWFDGLPKYNLF